MFKHKDLMLIKKYLSGGNSPDAMGLFIAWLIRKASMYGYVFSEEWYDIGSFESLADAQKRYSS
jgi:glucose-1-phosphate thymidylyltransferase